MGNMGKIPFQFRGANGRVCCTGYVDKPFSKGGQISLDGLCSSCRVRAIETNQEKEIRPNKATAKTTRVASPVRSDRPSKTIVNSRGELETLTGKELAVYNGETQNPPQNPPPQKERTVEELLAWCKSRFGDDVTPQELAAFDAKHGIAPQPQPGNIRPLPDPWNLATKGINLDSDPYLSALEIDQNRIPATLNPSSLPNFNDGQRSSAAPDSWMEAIERGKQKELTDRLRKEANQNPYDPQRIEPPQMSSVQSVQSLSTPVLWEENRGKSNKDIRGIETAEVQKKAQSGDPWGLKAKGINLPHLKSRDHE